MTTTATTSTASSVAANTTASQAATAKQSLAGDMNTFLKLLTTQLQHQDPLSPMDSSQFTSQLVQFASVEQQINTNSNLEKMLAGTNSSEMASAVTYLGTTVQGVSTSLPLQMGQASFTYTTPASTSKITATITDSAGNVVKTLTGDTTQGTHSLSWDGTDSYGTQLKDGAYKLALNADGADGSTTAVDTAVSGIVTSLGMDSNNQVQLFMGSVNMALKDVIKVTLPSSTSGNTSSSSSSSSSSNTAATGG